MDTKEVSGIHFWQKHLIKGHPDDHREKTVQCGSCGITLYPIAAKAFMPTHDHLYFGISCCQLKCTKMIMHCLEDYDSDLSGGKSGEYAMKYEEILANVTLWCKENEIPSDHGINHYLAVVNNLSFVDQKHHSAEEKIINKAACLLHDTDDRKLKKLLAKRKALKEGKIWNEEEWKRENEAEEKTGDKGAGRKKKYENAYRFLNEVKFEEKLIEEIIERISLVSTSENGEKLAEVKDKNKLIPSDCDKLEAIGLIGFNRCFKYSFDNGIPLVTPNTPLPINDQQLNKLLDGKTLDDYVKSRGKSDSAIAHCIDKLFLLRMSSGNHELETIFNMQLGRMKEMFFKICGMLTLMKIDKPIMFSKKAFDMESLGFILH